MKVVRDDTGDAKVKALATLRNLSAAADNQVMMASSDLGLLPLLIHYRYVLKLQPTTYTH